MHPASSHSRANGGSGSSGAGWVGTKHADPRTELGASQRDHVLSNMGSDHVAMLGASVGQDVLDQVVAILVAGNVDERDARPVRAALADSIQVSTEELRSANLQALLDHFGGKLICAVFGSVSNNVVNRTAAVGRSSMLANVLDTPVAKLSVGNNVNVGEDFFDAGSLGSKMISHPYILKTLEQERYLVFLETVLKNILNDQAASLAEGDFMPHAT